MLVRYQWTDDGTVEMCEYEEIKSDKDCECYHCFKKISKGQDCVKLTDLEDNGIYIIHKECSEEACF